MRKVPTLFLRDLEDMRYVLPEVHPDCQWVLDGEGTATRKYDGTCVLIHRDGLAVHAFARREVKPGKQSPQNFVEVEHDETTGKTVGWEPAEQSGFANLIAEAVADAVTYGGGPLPGTHELVGPKINRNPEGFTAHHLIPHADADRIEVKVPPDALEAWSHLLGFMATFPHEGIVWHHPDGRMAKLKVKDFPQEKLIDE